MLGHVLDRLHRNHLGRHLGNSASDLYRNGNRLHLLLKGRFRNLLGHGLGNPNHLKTTLIDRDIFRGRHRDVFDDLFLLHLCIGHISKRRHRLWAKLSCHDRTRLRDRAIGRCRSHWDNGRQHRLLRCTFTTLSIHVRWHNAHQTRQGHAVKKCAVHG